MAPLTIAFMPLATDLISVRTLGEAGLVTVGAFVIGFVVSRFVPARLKPEFWGFLAALLVVSGLAYLGSAGAGLALFIVIALGALLIFSGAAS